MLVSAGPIACNGLENSDRMHATSKNEVRASPGEAAPWQRALGGALERPDAPAPAAPAPEAPAREAPAPAESAGQDAESPEDAADADPVGLGLFARIRDSHLEPSLACRGCGFCS